MYSPVDLQLAYNIINAPIREFPFPHVYVNNVFPADFYREIRAHLPPREALTKLSATGRVGPGYPDTRLIMRLPETANLDAAKKAFWDGVAGWLLGGNFGRMMLMRFAPYLEARLGDLAKHKFFDEALLVQDYTTYALPPHTDTPQKVLTFLFYLPGDERLRHRGTSLYIPMDSSLRCPGTQNHSADKFLNVVDLPFVPNSMLAFVKTTNSFHGVAPLTETNVRRDLLLYDIKTHTPPELAPEPPQSAAAAGSGSRFSF